MPAGVIEPVQVLGVLVVCEEAESGGFGRIWPTSIVPLS